MKKNRIRVLHVNDEKKYGGGENQTFLLIKELEKLNVENFIILRRKSLLHYKLLKHLPENRFFF